MSIRRLVYGGASWRVWFVVVVRMMPTAGADPPQCTDLSQVRVGAVNQGVNFTPVLCFC